MNATDLVKVLRAQARTVSVTCEALGIARTYRVVEGDIRISEDQLLAYAAERCELAAKTAGGPAPRGLIAIESKGKILRWERGKVLEYCVWKPSFQSSEEYASVVEAMRTACDNWAEICGVRFRHRVELDDDASFRSTGETFAVLRSAGGGSTIALAFFPDASANERKIWIFDGYFAADPVFSRVGVLRHELGHVLGFRHEHIAPEAPKLFEPEDTAHIIQVTEYTPTSVMHYLGAGVGDKNLELKPSDREGAVRVYGYPDFHYEFVT